MSKTPSIEALEAQLYIEEKTFQPEESGLDDLLKQMQNVGEHLPKDKTEAWLRYPPPAVHKAMREANAEPIKVDAEIGLTFFQVLLPMFIFMFLLAVASTM